MSSFYTSKNFLSDQSSLSIDEEVLPGQLISFNRDVTNLSSEDVIDSSVIIISANDPVHHLAAEGPEHHLSAEGPEHHLIADATEHQIVAVQDLPEHQDQFVPNQASTSIDTSEVSFL